MFALFDMSEAKLVRVVLFESGEVLAEESREGKNVELLSVLDAVLVRAGQSKDDVAGIAVVVGTGTFTSTRLAVTVANTFAFAQQISVVGVSVEEATDVVLLEQKIHEAVPGQLVSATYSGAPRIGLK